MNRALQSFGAQAGPQPFRGSHPSGDGEGARGMPLEIHARARAASDAARRASGVRAAPDAPSDLLELSANTVTSDLGVVGYEVAPCRCKSAFCPACCRAIGYRLRDRLVPIVETFKSVMMVTLTMDPTLFASPRHALLYLCDRRCLGRTMQDLFRGGWLHTRRYFYAVEWQCITEMPHIHVLLDAAFILFTALLDSWSKHRPNGAGPVVGNRPPFGTVIFSKREFVSAQHAAFYATKYVAKYPEHGFPEWVMNMGGTRRVRRYGASRGLWGTAPRPERQSERYRSPSSTSYAERSASCCTTLNMFRVSARVCPHTGEAIFKREWIAELDAHPIILEAINDGSDPPRKSRTLAATTPAGALAMVSAAAHRPIECIASVRPKFGGGAR